MSKNPEIKQTGGWLDGVMGILIRVRNRWRGKNIPTEVSSIENPKQTIKSVHLERKIQFLFSTPEETKAAAKQVMTSLTKDQRVIDEVDQLTLNPDNATALSWDYLPGFESLKTDLKFQKLANGQWLLSISKVRSETSGFRTEIEQLLGKKSLLAEAVVEISFNSSKACQDYLQEVDADTSEELLNAQAQTQAYWFLAQKMMYLESQFAKGFKKDNYPMNDYVNSDKQTRDVMFKELYDAFCQKMLELKFDYSRSLEFDLTMPDITSDWSDHKKMKMRYLKLVLPVPINTDVAQAVVVGIFGGVFSFDDQRFVLSQHPTDVSVYVTPNPEHGLSDKREDQEQINSEATRLARQKGPN